MAVGSSARHRAAVSRLLLAAGVGCLLLAVLPLEQAAWFLISAAAHECGHAVIMRLLGMPVRGMTFGAGGAVLHGDFTAVPFRHELLAAAAGPAVNILLLVLLSRHSTACAVNALLACYNLLPLRGNDGAVMLGAAAAMCGHGDVMRRILRIMGELLWALLLMLGAWVFWFGALADTDGVSFGYGALFFCVLVRGLGKTEEYL